MDRSKSNQEPWQQVLIDGQSTIQDAIRNLDESGLQISLVVNKAGSLLGTVMAAEPSKAGGTLPCGRRGRRPGAHSLRRGESVCGVLSLGKAS